MGATTRREHLYGGLRPRERLQLHLRQNRSRSRSRTDYGKAPVPSAAPVLQFRIRSGFWAGLREIVWRGSDTLLQGWHQPCWYRGDEDGTTSSTTECSAVFKEHFTATLYRFSSDRIVSKTHRCLYGTCLWVLMGELFLLLPSSPSVLSFMINKLAADWISTTCHDK